MNISALHLDFKELNNRIRNASEAVCIDGDRKSVV
jgi:hypothetical protein